MSFTDSTQTPNNKPGQPGRALDYSKQRYSTRKPYFAGVAFAT
jgi:hypothetical protein